MRKGSIVALMLALLALAMLAWFGMLSAERDAERAREDGARHAAVGAALAISAETEHGGDAATVVSLAERASDVRLLVRDGNGDVVAGHASGSAHLMTVTVPGSDLTVAAEVHGTTGLGLGRYSGLVTLLAFLVMVVSLGLLAVVARDRRRAHAEIERLAQRWEEVAAADDLTGLGNRLRLLEDAGALIARSGRYGGSFAIALFDVGDGADDERAMDAARIVAGQARGADMVYRVGAGQFVSVLPEQDETGATIAANRIRGALEAQLEGEIKSGIAAFAPWLPCSASALLTRAELDMYSAEMAPPSAEEAVVPRP